MKKNPGQNQNRQPTTFATTVTERRRALPLAAMKSKSSSQQCQRSKGG
ncbi:MAG: hypothetical protein NT003_00160 [Candidatus Magasanikbacteria bacterium]|nr:hypothetical protein [Candidatus Magasanikbacteria bacterium]